MKIRICTICNSEMSVHKNSGRKICKECYPEYQREKSRLYYERVKQSGRIHEYRNKTRIRSKEAHKKDPRRRMVTAAKVRAKKNGIPFDITYEDVFLPDECPILKKKFVFGTEYCMSLDRIIPELGYTKGNVQIISMKANAMKNSATVEELVSMANWVLSKVVKEPNVPEIT